MDKSSFKELFKERKMPEHCVYKIQKGLWKKIFCGPFDQCYQVVIEYAHKDHALAARRFADPMYNFIDNHLKNYAIIPSGTVIENN